jgi:hypothetical protein
MAELSNTMPKVTFGILSFVSKGTWSGIAMLLHVCSNLTLSVQIPCEFVMDARRGHIFSFGLLVGLVILT